MSEPSHRSTEEIPFWSNNPSLLIRVHSTADGLTQHKLQPSLQT